LPVNEWLVQIRRLIRTPLRRQIVRLTLSGSKPRKS
jgi:hypothetical protein